MDKKETKEELLERMPEGSEELVDKMSEKVANDMKREKKRKRHFFGKRNRRAFIRQERPHIVESKERGLEKIWAFHRRAFGILAYHRYVLWQKETLANDRELTDGDPRVAIGHEEYRQWVSVKWLNFNKAVDTALQEMGYTKEVADERTDPSS